MYMNNMLQPTKADPIKGIHVHWNANCLSNYMLLYWRLSNLHAHLQTGTDVVTSLRRLPLMNIHI